MRLDEAALFNHREISPEDFDASPTAQGSAGGMCALGADLPLTLSAVYPSELVLDTGFNYSLRRAAGDLHTSKFLRNSLE